MSTLSKSLVSTVIGVSFLISIYQANRASKFQKENQRILQAIASPPAMHQPDSAEDSPPEIVASIPEKSHESEEARMARLREAADESIRQQRAAAELDGSNVPVTYSLIEVGGKGLTEGAAKAAGLNKHEKEAVDEILTKTWESVSDDFATRATFVEEESNEKDGVSVYMVSARPDRGKSFKKVLDQALDAEVGEAKRNILMKGFQVYETFGGFGRFDTRLEFNVKKGVFKFAYLNPLSGEPSRFGNKPMKEFKDLFGDSFEIPDVEDTSNAGGSDPKRHW